MTRADDVETQLARLRAILERARRERRTMTYLQIADALELEPPKRIHRVARLLERSMKRDVEADRPPLAALAVSRARAGPLPAPGFFDRARRLGLYAGDDPAVFHASLLDRLFSTPDPIE
ncbi:MAG: hypothetical protein R3323_10260 [Wenzhouxiangellaceae bacterium]|nr:hypothetical protein [Wenzhouxiangellaceae bacterium]